MKKALCIVIAIILLAGLSPVLAVDSGEARAVIGANLSAEQIETVYGTFGVSRGSVPELTITNAEERSYLEGLVDESVIGTNSISCVYIRQTEEEGYSVSTSNINWCTVEMYRNALLTAGIDHVDVVVTAPFPVSGTAALAGIYKAYEDMTGQQLDALAKEIGTQELVITGELADEIGSYDATEIVNELKLILDDTKNMTDEELATEIRRIAAEYNVSLNESQVQQLITLCRQLEKLSDSELVDKVKSLQDAVRKLGELQDRARETQEKLSTFKEKAAAFAETVRNYTQPVIDFFRNLFHRS